MVSCMEGIRFLKIGIEKRVLIDIRLNLGSHDICRHACALRLTFTDLYML